MKIAVTSAFGWPYVRRGNRVAYELASYLASRGNEVHFITTKPGELRRDKAMGNLLIRSFPVIDNPVLTHFRVEYWQTFGLTCLKALLKEDYDIVHTSLTLDAFAASLNRTIRGTPFVPVLIQSDPLYKDARRAKRLFQRAVGTASRLVTISNFVNDILKRDFGLEGVMIPCPVDTSKFYCDGQGKSGAPRILCTAAMTMERKRVPLLVKAFERLVEHVPDAVLQLAGETTPQVTQNLLMTVNETARRSIEIVDITSDEVLSSFYRNASLTVLPSLNEAFGMVTTESLASGTPVVGTRSGGTAEILDDPRVGVLFEPDDGPEELCAALIKGIELSSDPETPGRCAEHAMRYSWNTLGPKYIELDMEVLNETGRKPSRRKLTENGLSTSSLGTAGPVPLSGDPGRQKLNRFFLDVLDGLDITMQTYYETESCMPRCIYILRWMLAKKVRTGNVLLLSSHPHFLAVLLKKLSFRVRHLVLNDRVDSGQEHIEFELARTPEAIAGLNERFDVIVCDDVLHHLKEPEELLRSLKGHLAHDGVLILATPNPERRGGKSDLRGEDKTECNTSGNSPGMPDTKQDRCIGHSLRKLQNAGVNAGFSVIERTHIIGEKQIDKTNTFAHVPVKTYLSNKLLSSLELVSASSRSHLFMVLRNG